MNKFRKGIATLLFLLLTTLTTFGQGTQANVEMATGLRASGMIYVVVSVILIIHLGLLLFLWRLDRKIGKLERESNTHN